jgi:acetyl-CoA C-acetyltransferase
MADQSRAMATHPNTPILVGVGQCVDHWDGADRAGPPSPLSLAALACRRALADSGAANALTATIDRVAVVQAFLDFDRSIRQPFGRCANPPGTLAAELGLAPAKLIYSVAGGDQPQALVNEAAEAVFAGEANAVLLAGSEATAAMKVALKMGITLDWSRSVLGHFEDRGFGPELLSAYERSNGFGMPTQTYPAFEHSLRGRLGNSIAAHQDLMAELWAGFSEVAATNPYAQYPVARSAAFLKAESAENYRVADPYIKWHVAQDAVNQGAAVIMTSVAQATALGIDPAKWIYLHGYAQVLDKTPTQRPDMGRSQAISLALDHALSSAGKATADIAHFDLYSCFPCAVLLATEALGLDWRTTPATVTGGLPFFGGAGNNYSMHAIATMVERLRANPGDFGLILANGGFLTKQAVGIYSAMPKADWAPVSSGAIQQIIDETPVPRLLSEEARVKVTSYTVTYAKGKPHRAYVVGANDEGVALARVRDLAALLAGDPLGHIVELIHEDGVNYVEADARSARAGL